MWPLYNRTLQQEGAPSHTAKNTTAHLQPGFEPSWGGLEQIVYHFHNQSFSSVDELKRATVEARHASDSFSTLALYKFIYLLTYLLRRSQKGTYIRMYHDTIFTQLVLQNTRNRNFSNFSYAALHYVEKTFKCSEMIIIYYNI